MVKKDLMDGRDADIELQQDSNKPVNYQNLSLTNASMASSTLMDLPACSAAPMAGSFGSLMWDHRLDAQNLSYSDLNFHDAGASASPSSTRAELGLNADLVLRNGISQPSLPSMLPQRVPHLPTDSGFIERAARLSLFGGSFAQMMSPCLLPHSMNVFTSKQITGMHSQRDETLIEDKQLFKNGTMLVSHVEAFDVAKYGAACVSGNQPDEDEYSSEQHPDSTPENSSQKGFDYKKRKKHAEEDQNHVAKKIDLERNKDFEDTKPNENQNLTTSASGGKHAKAHGSDPPKEGYVHVRARRGQATNSHSLAERVRREKISERMKFLQELVPGCSKVTGKALMLDEIINYVQSLQRQVEFLSMKLATVYPHMDFNIAENLAQDGFRCHPGTVPLPPLLRPPQHGLMQVGNSSVIIRRPMNISPGIECGSIKEPNMWGDELHNIVHLGFNSISNSQGLQDSSPRTQQ